MSTYNDWVLGIDLGANSLGYALIDEQDQRIVHSGVRIFEAGVANLDSSKEQSKNTERRLARQVRRQTDRRRHRYQAVFRVLQQHGLLPYGKRQEVLQSLDQALSVKLDEHVKLPYLLRTRALDEALEPHELGRTLYHLGQRRGFLSNKKAMDKGDDDSKPGLIKKEIEGLRGRIQESGARTLGEYLFLHVDPHRERIRSRFTDRKMYQEEFERIWDKQRQYHPDHLTDDLRTQLHHAMFFQRPLKDQSDKVGRCELEPGESRAPMARLEVQRFRLLVVLNNLRLYRGTEAPRALTDEERNAIVNISESGETLKLPAIKKRLKLPPACKFSIEHGKEDKVPGNATAARIQKAIGRAWEDMATVDRHRLVRTLVEATGSEEELAEKLQHEYTFDIPSAIALSEVTLPSGYYSISLKAIERLTPLLEQGMTYPEAKKHAGYDDLQRTEPLDLLPPVQDSLPTVRNPIVVRALTELRKTVNAIIRKFGKPGIVRVELARDIRRGYEERMRLLRTNRDREAERNRAKEALAPYLKCPPEAVKRRDVEKYLLWEECRHQCPYTGRTISMEALFGPAPLFQIEHIIPLSRSLDDSFDNKTLCANEANAQKANRSPWEAFGETDDWDRMVEAVKGFNNSRKLSRFVMMDADRDTLLEEFTTRQLNDTRYASKLAARYLGLLYGGVNDADGQKRVYTCAGPVTAYLRREWKLDSILNPEAPGKSRDDHRHHAVDAITVALCSQGTVQRLSEAAERAGSVHRMRFGGFFDLPWPTFKQDVAAAIEKINVSLRPDCKLQGQMHDATFYSKSWQGEDGKKYVSVRKPVAADGYQIEDIVDTGIRARVQEKLNAVGSKKKLAADPPLDAAGRPIKKVRVRVVAQSDLAVVGEGPRARNVSPNSIHHTEILRDETDRGRARYRHVPVTTIDAMQRQRRRLPIVQKEHGERVSFLCTLRPGDVIEAAQTNDGPKRLWRVRTIKSSGQLETHLLVDARQKSDIQKARALWAPTVNTLFSSGARKVSINYLGEVVPAND
jgi:CRISPR-associated endonuclease Csn1